MIKKKIFYGNKLVLMVLVAGGYQTICEKIYYPLFFDFIFTKLSFLYSVKY